MNRATAHIINHTHWDREWFLTSVYTSRWIPGLVDKLEELFAANPTFRFLFDGQTLVIEDLLAIAPDYRARIEPLIASGQLSIGPYYCQPDWQLSGGELLIRNLLYGQADVCKYGGAMRTGWMVDTFGHISQAPQIHRLFAIDVAYVWRGVPELMPYFRWRGADRSELFAINLFGGYRNLYGVSHAPEVAALRLQREIDKLAPFYPTSDIPLFDGYDLEDSPEDPVSFFAAQPDLAPELTLLESTPAAYAAAVREKLTVLPTLEGELNSGKYGATFPGVSSARTYLKIMAHDCERLLFRLCEPVAALATFAGRPYPHAAYETWARLLLQNAVHDCLCGVSIDQVHEKMEDGYHRAFTALRDDLQDALAALLADFAPGTYAVSTNAFTTEAWLPVEDRLARIHTRGVGVWPVEEWLTVEDPAEPVDSFVWRNDHYRAEVSRAGVVKLGDALLGRIAVYAEHGDTYSDLRGAWLGDLTPTGPLTLAARSPRHAVVTCPLAWHNASDWVTVELRLYFDDSPLLRWQIDLDSHGVDLRIEMEFATVIRGRILAGMPFDQVERALVDRDLLDRELPADLAGVLLGQREIGAVTSFPFQETLAISDGEATCALFARGLRTYEASPDGRLMLVLRRAVESLTKADLPGRVGDAGPFFYVPDARCERPVRHELALAMGSFAPDGLEIQRWSALFQNPPLLVSKQGSGKRTTLAVLEENLPLSALAATGQGLIARFCNPTAAPVSLQQPRRLCRVDGQGGAPVVHATAVAPKQILTTQLAPVAMKREPANGQGECRLLTPLTWRVGANRSRPDPARLAEMAAQVTILERELAAIATQLEGADGRARLHLEHRYYVLKREALELELSQLLNQRKLEQHQSPTESYLYGYDAEIAAVGLALNRLRIKRRIFDYVVQAIA